jgi:hypothetical protein
MVEIIPLKLRSEEKDKGMPHAHVPPPLGVVCRCGVLIFSNH